MKRLIILAACVLAGCGGGSNHDAGTVEQPPVTPPVTAADRFFATVQGLFGRGEEGEPVAVDAVAATTPDNTEPEPVK